MKPHILDVPGADASCFPRALSMEMAADVQSSVSWIAAQDHRGTIKSLVLQGAGDHFCPGGNLYKTRDRGGSLAAAALGAIGLFGGFCHLRTLPLPISCAAHGTVLGGGLAVCLLTDYVISDHSATFQVGERSRGIHPAGLLDQTLTESLGPALAMGLHLTEQLIVTEVYEMALVQAVAPSVRSAQQLALNVAYQFSWSASKGALQTKLSTLVGMLPPSEQRTLVVDAVAQAKSLVAKKTSRSSGQLPVFTNCGGSSARGSLHKTIQAVLGQKLRAVSLSTMKPLSTMKRREVPYATKMLKGDCSAHMQLQTSL